MSKLASRSLRHFRLTYSDEESRYRETLLPYWMGWRLARWKAHRLSKRFGDVKLVYVSNLMRWRVGTFSIL
ncbi:MAG: hypothetical protein KAJ05_04310 [Candidatus Latescibacteria bacterium]|nr:hypothetical protein [Candidatus Latescibacterota bacterium]MCK5526346.1 hypothetical protein [Candidatus Latescibacterota bacterium]